MKHSRTSTLLLTLLAAALMSGAAAGAAAGTGQPIGRVRSEVIDEAVTVSWSAAPDSGDLVLFRSRDPIQSTETLAAATRIAIVSGSQQQFRDYPIPGVPAYYALVSARAIADGSIELQPGRNTTTAAVQLPLGSRISDRQFFAPYSFRATPLPYLQPVRDMLQGDGDALPRPLPEQRITRLEPAGAAAVERLMQGLPSQRSHARAATVLPEDAGNSDKGVAFTLRSIVDGPFSHGQWRQAREQIENLLTLPLPSEVESRARFYLGQTFYYEGLYQRAVLEFLLARPHYHAQASDWIAASLRRADLGVR